MATHMDAFDSLSTRDLARACAQRSSRRRAPLSDPDPCYELFCRACTLPSDEDAWDAIVAQYRRLVLCWLGQYGSDDTVQEVFTRFWQAQEGAEIPFTSRFPNIQSVMGYLKRCAVTVRIETWRAEERYQGLLDRLQDARVARLVLARVQPGQADLDFRQSIRAKLADEEEQVVFTLTYYYDLSPREIQAERPDLFPDTRRVHRVKENMLKRLRRDPDVGAWWPDRREHSDSK